MVKRYWTAGLLAIVASGAAFLIMQPDDREPPRLSSRVSPGTPTPAPSTLSVPQRAGLSDYRPLAPEIAPAKQVAPPPVASVEPQMPPVPYRFAGTLGQQVFLAKDTTILAVGPGEVLDELYRVDAIDDKGIALTYLPLGRTVVIYFQPAAAGPR